MLIIKVLNNNVVVTTRDNKEIIVMGKGIAFKKKVGEEIPADKIDKVYTLSDSNVSSKFQELLSNIPIEQFKLSDEIISYAKTELGKKLNESIYISLTDHIYSAIERYEEGITVKNVLLWDIKRFYKDEYHVGLKALELIKSRFSVCLPEDEAGFIALHLVNAQMDENLPIIYEITKVMQEIITIVRYYYSLSFDDESVYYYRFITHLKFFAQRLFNGTIYCDEADDGLFEVIKVKYADAYVCVEKITKFIEEKYKYILANEEKLYLTIHVAKIVLDTKKINQKDRVSHI